MSEHSPLRPAAPDTEVTELLDLALDLICIAGLDGYFKRVNKAWTDVLGYTKEELLGKQGVWHLLERINDPELAPRRTLIDVKLIERESV